MSRQYKRLPGKRMPAHHEGVHKASAAEANSCRRGVRLFAIIQQTETVVNDFLLYHRKTGLIFDSKNRRSRLKNLRVGQKLYPCLRKKQAGYTKYGQNGFSAENSEFRAKFPGFSGKKEVGG